MATEYAQQLGPPMEDHQGEARVVVLWGPAWSGKSTLCRAMLRCLPPLPQLPVLPKCIPNYHSPHSSKC